MGDATAFKVLPNDQGDRIDLFLIESVHGASRLAIKPRNISVLAGQLLGAATKSLAKSGKPHPYKTKNDKVTATVAPCTGHNILPGRQPGSLVLAFHFGETTLGIPMARSDAELFAQRLLMLAAEGPRQ